MIDGAVESLAAIGGGLLAVVVITAAWDWFRGLSS